MQIIKTKQLTVYHALYEEQSTARRIKYWGNLDASANFPPWILSDCTKISEIYKISMEVFNSNHIQNTKNA